VRLGLVVLLALLVTAFGCSPVTSDRPIALPQPGEPAKPVWVIHHGWHVGLAVRRLDVRRDVWAEAHEIGPFDYVEIGWGDGDFYPAARGTVGQALRAAFRSRSSVLHVAAFDGRVERFFAVSPVVELALTPDGFDDLCRFIAAAYTRSGDGAAFPVGAGLYGASRFYRARDRYHVFHNSNQWVARALRQAGVPVSPSLYAGTVFARVARLGIVHRAPL
jgi:uncharacterized protein (TIGR02117 family)